MDAQHNQSGIGRTRTLLLISAALTPFLCAVVAHAIGTEARSPAPGEEPAPLVFEQYLVNLGEVPPLPMLEGRFRFTNRGRHVVTITELRPSCGCLNPRLEQRVYQPGESGEFFVRVETAGEKPGPKEYFIDLSYDVEVEVSDDGSPSHQVQLTFKLELPEKKIVITPRALIFYQLGRGATTQEIVVSDYRQQPLRIVDWACRSPYVSAAVLEAGANPLATFETRIAVTVSDGVPPGRHETLLELETDDPRFPLLRVPLWLQGPQPSTPQTATGERAGDGPPR